MLATFPATRASRHNNFPSDARTPTAPPLFPITVTYCSTPPALHFKIELYPPPPQFSILARQISFPVFRSRAASAAPSAPGVHTTRSPSISGLSLNPHPDIIFPPKSLLKFFRHTSAPSPADMHTKSPCGES